MRFFNSSLLKTGFFSFIMLNMTVAISAQKVSISQTVDHPALNATVQGISNALAQAGYIAGKDFEIRIESAQANGALAGQIAQKFINQSPDIIVGVGTMSAQSFAKAAAQSKIKLIFSSITDPLGVGLVESVAKPGKSTSGVSNFVSLEPQLKLFQQLQPRLKKLGVLYNPGEANSVFIMKELKALCPKLGLELVPQAIMKTSDVPQSATKLSQNVDAIFVSNDNTALSSLASIIRIATLAKIPVYVSDTDAVKQGALAALGPNQYEIGQQTGDMIARVLKGEDIATLSVEFPEKVDLYINLQTAKILGLDISQDVIALAKKVIRPS